jgi:hypothetical protein
MSPLRFLLVLLLTVALDLSSPVPPHAAGEGLEEFEEVVHVRPGRRPFRLARETVAPAVAHEARTVELQRPRPLPPAPSRPATTAVLIRKLPAPVAEPASAPEDH